MELIRFVLNMIPEAAKYSTYKECLWAAKQSIQFKSSMELGITGSLLATTRQIIQSAARTCTALFGYIPMALYQMASTFITAMGIRPTTALRTLSFYLQLHTSVLTQKNSMLPTQSAGSVESKLLRRLQRFGTAPQLGWIGTQNMGRERGSVERNLPANAHTAESNMKYSMEQQNVDSVAPNVKQQQGSHLVSMTKFASALSALQSSQQINTAARSAALLHAKAA